jgi:hypothetical protein
MEGDAGGMEGGTGKKEEGKRIAKEERTEDDIQRKDGRLMSYHANLNAKTKWLLHRFKSLKVDGPLVGGEKVKRNFLSSLIVVGLVNGSKVGGAGLNGMLWLYG